MAGVPKATRPEGARVGLGLQAATYGTGFFSLSMTSMATLAVPLWAVEIGASPFWIGFVVAARSYLTLALSIHGGVLIDKLGARRMMLWTTAIAMVLAPLHPALPYVWAIVLFQAVIGLCNVLGWVGAQTLINQYTRGDPSFTGRFTFFTTLGTFSGPLVAGLAWHQAGPWGGFGVMGAWSAAMLVACWFLPPTPKEQKAGRPVMRARDFLPSLTSYVAAYRVAIRPAMAFVVTGTFLRNCLFGMRLSFFPVYLTMISMNSSEVGMLLAVSSLAASPAALLYAPVRRFLSMRWVMMLSLGAMAVGLTFTPFIESFAGLAGLSVLYGIGMGLNLTLIISMMSHAVRPEEQGLAFGIRATANPLGTLVVPLVMGTVAEFYGIAPAFYIVGPVILVLIAASWALTMRPGADAPA